MEKVGPFDCCCSHQSATSQYHLSTCVRAHSGQFWKHFV